jgi:hypothetical protein
LWSLRKLGFYKHDNVKGGFVVMILLQCISDYLRMRARHIKQ